MSISEHIYEIYGELLIMAVMLMVAHYVFLEPKWKKWQCILNVVSIPVLLYIEFFVENEAKIFAGLFWVGLNISFAREKRRIRGFFLIIPIFGICLGIMQSAIFLPELLFGIADDSYSALIDLITLVLLFLFAWRGKGWREHFELEMHYRTLQRWESRLLIGIGVLIYVVTYPVLDNEDLMQLDFSLRMYMAVILIITLILTVSVIVLVMQGNQRDYYKGMAELNEHYLRAELKHFQTYQESQIETRRIRHDMKNHLQSMMYLANENKLEELRRYLEKLNISVAQTDMELHCGNYIADAICNEKNQYAKKNGIHFEIEGRMPENMQMEAIDICTIFSNAIDNAIEAVTEIPEMKQRWIKLKIQNQGDILFLCFTNPVQSDKARRFGERTSKKDRINHGFGLQNIRRAAEKYHGELTTHIETEDEEANFVLELMLMGQSQQI